MGLFKLILKIAAPLPKLEAYERYLFIGPHPDDIEIGAGATAAKLASLGKKVSFVICTDGRFGDGNAPDGIKGDALVTLRKEEALRSAEMLGIKDVRFLELSDGGFYTKEELENRLAKVIGEVQPEVIFAPDPCVTSECHRDHLNVGNAARHLACLAPYPGIMERHGAACAPVQALAYYMTAKPTCYVKTSGFLKKQLDAIFTSHTSQFPKGASDAASIQLYLKLRSITFGLRSFKGCAEGFRVLGTTQMHCMPEAER